MYLDEFEEMCDAMREFVDSIVASKKYSGSYSLRYKEGLMPPKDKHMSFPSGKQGARELGMALLRLHALEADTSVSDRPIIHSISIM